MEKESVGSQEQKGEQREIGGRHMISQSIVRSMGCLSDYLSLCLVPSALNSRVLHQLLQVLDFKAGTHSRWEALAHFHEDNHKLVVEQEGSQSPSRMQQSTLL